MPYRIVSRAHLYSPLRPRLLSIYSCVWLGRVVCAAGCHNLLVLFAEAHLDRTATSSDVPKFAATVDIHQRIADRIRRLPVSLKRQSRPDSPATADAKRCCL